MVSVTFRRSAVSFTTKMLMFQLTLLCWLLISTRASSTTEIEIHQEQQNFPSCTSMFGHCGTTVTSFASVAVPALFFGMNRSSLLLLIVVSEASVRLNISCWSRNMVGALVPVNFTNFTTRVIVPAAAVITSTPVLQPAPSCTVANTDQCNAITPQLMEASINVILSAEHEVTAGVLKTSVVFPSDLCVTNISVTLQLVTGAWCVLFTAYEKWENTLTVIIC